MLQILCSSFSGNTSFGYFHTLEETIRHNQFNHYSSISNKMNFVCLGDKPPKCYHFYMVIIGL